MKQYQLWALGRTYVSESIYQETWVPFGFFDSVENARLFAIGMRVSQRWREWKIVEVQIAGEAVL